MFSMETILLKKIHAEMSLKLYLFHVLLIEAITLCMGTYSKPANN